MTTYEGMDLVRNATVVEHTDNASARCPLTGHLVGISLQSRLAVPGGVAIWWHCLACEGWHVRVVLDSPPPVYPA